MKIRKLLITGILFTGCSWYTTLFSCSTQHNIKKINLFIQTDTLRPGESTYVRAIMEPTHKRTTNLNWSIINAPPSVTISNEGLVSVPLDLKITKPHIIEVTATVKNNPAISSSVKLTLLMTPSLDFQGFENNEILHLDRKHNVVSTPIIKTSDYVYETSKNIDLFVGDDHFDAPSFFTSFVYFKPLMSSTKSTFMSFKLEGGLDMGHPLLWGSGYVDGSWVKTIPDFTTFNPEYYFETIVVHFACDPSITFLIHFNIWLGVQQTGSGIISYIPNDIDDDHHLEMVIDGKYDMNIFCPDKEIEGLYRRRAGSFYCSRPPQVYTEFIINQFQFNESLDPDIKSSLTLIITNSQKIVRPFDHMVFYKFDVDYSFDLSKKKYPAEHWHYQSFSLGSIDITDPLYDSEVPCWIEFFVDWI